MQPAGCCPGTAAKRGPHSPTDLLANAEVPLLHALLTRYLLALHCWHKDAACSTIDAAGRKLSFSHERIAITRMLLCAAAACGGRHLRAGVH